MIMIIIIITIIIKKQKKQKTKGKRKQNWACSMHSVTYSEHAGLFKIPNYSVDNRIIFCLI